MAELYKCKWNEIIYLSFQNAVERVQMMLLTKHKQLCWLQLERSSSFITLLTLCEEGVRNGEKWKQQENNSPQNSWAKDSHLRNPHTETPRPSSHCVQTHCGLNSAVTSPVWSDDAMCEISTVIIHAQGQWGLQIFIKVQCKVTL